MFKLNKNEKILFYSIGLIILIFFSSIFILSLFKIVNAWSYSQAHVNYFDGFVRRGLFGTIMLFFDQYLNLNSKLFFSAFFIILTVVNISIFLYLIKKYIHNYLLFLFLSLNPTLILFSFNDLGGYQRFDFISIFLILFHSLIVYSYNHQVISLQSYKKKLYFFIFPIIFFSLFIHEIQSWSILFHLFLTINVIKTKIKKIIFSYLIFLPPIIFIFTYQVDEQVVNAMINNLNKKELFLDAIHFASSSRNNLSVIDYEFKTNVLNFYNLRINLFFIMMATIPFYLILIFLKNNGYLVQNNINIKFLIFSHIPFLALFLIGDTGRWINLISFISLGYIAQFSFKKKIKNYNFKRITFNNFFIYSFIFITIIIYLFFVRLPHCCDLEKKQISIWGGISSKILAYIRILKKDDHPDYNLDLRFRN